MKKILLASAFALFGTFAMANESINENLDEIKEISIKEFTDMLLRGDICLDVEFNYSCCYETRTVCGYNAEEVGETALLQWDLFDDYWCGEN